MDFNSAYAHGFARVAACTTQVRVADPNANLHGIVEAIKQADAQAVAVAVFPELCLSGYAIDDLLLQDALLGATKLALSELAAATAGLLPVVAVGAPLAVGNRVYNCAVVIHDGVILGVVPKSYLPSHREFYERRHFGPGDDQHGDYVNWATSRCHSGPIYCSRLPILRTW